MAHLSEAAVAQINAICDRYVEEKNSAYDDFERHSKGIWLHSA